MGTKKDIFGKVLYCSMGKEDKPKDLPKGEDGLSFDYKRFLEITKTGNYSFDAYVELLSREMQIYDGVDPYEKDALKSITDKADSFLKRHAGISYDDFLRQSNPEIFTENDFGKLPEGKNLRRRLFEHRARLYLSSLEDFEQRGHDVSKLLPEIQQSTIPYLKKEKDEPTFREIMKVLQRDKRDT